MRIKNVVAIVLTVVVFAAVAFLGVSSVYRVNAVTLEVSFVSDAAKPEAEQLREKLLKRYENESIFRVTRAQAEEETADFPYFRITSFKKSYPNRIVVGASEDAEIFAVQSQDLYYILGGDGTVLGIRSDSKNRSDGADNVVVTGVAASGVKGEILGGDECIPALTEFCAATADLLGGIRSNLVSVSVFKPTSSLSDATFSLTMREGVKVAVYNPLSLVKKKAAAFASLYLSLSDAERLSGKITVTDDALDSTNVLVSYSKNG